jgi:hypothetical protein
VERPQRGRYVDVTRSAVSAPRGEGGDGCPHVSRQHRRQRVQRLNPSEEAAQHPKLGRQSSRCRGHRRLEERHHRIDALDDVLPTKKGRGEAFFFLKSVSLTNSALFRF